MAKMKDCLAENILPLGLKDIIEKVFGESVKIGEQQDAHEFLIMLLHTIEGSKCLKAIEESNNIEEYNFDVQENRVNLNEIFEGSLTSTITCQK